MIKPLEPAFASEETLTENLRLLRQSSAFAEAHYDAIDRDRSRLSVYMTHVADMTLDLEREFLQRLESLWEQHESIDYAVFCRHSGRLVGCIGTPELNWKHHRVEIGYMVFSDFEGRGLAREGVSELVQQLRMIGFHRVYLRCNAKNHRSRRLAEALGFQLEGILRADVIENGVWRDTCVYASLPEQSLHGR
jgi:RimJ/RimL family protein N-acetyltransferase